MCFGFSLINSTASIKIKVFDTAVVLWLVYWSVWRLKFNVITELK